MIPSRMLESSRRALAPILATLAFATIAPSARADAPGTAGATAEAEAPEAAFARGLASFEAGRFSEAIATWEGIVRTLGDERGFKVLYNLGLAYEADRDATRAIERFELFLKRLAEQPAQLTPDLEERRQDAAERARAMKATRGAVVVPAPPARACAVRVDGGPPRPAGFTAFLAPGEHTIEVFSGTSDARSVRVSVAVGASRTIDTAPPVTAAPPRVVVLPAPESAPEMPTPWIIGGGTLFVASFGLPLALGLHAAELRAGAVRLGIGHTMYSSAAKGYEDARAAYHAAYALPAILGAATLAVAAVGVVRVRTHAPRPAAPGPSATLAVEPGGVWVRGVF